MRVAILHYHLRPGGVTRVIELAWQALHEAGVDALVISGENQPTGGRIPQYHVAVVPELAYGSSADVVRPVKAACHAAWGADADILHIHNHALGKNVALPKAVAQWARARRPMVLQLHDFAENNRPQNYRLLCEGFGGREQLSAGLYPHSGQILIACLTRGAASRFPEAHVLPNPVLLPSGGEPFRPEGERVFVYPTRGIPRKNLGEVLLHACTGNVGDRYVISSAPRGGSDLNEYLQWQQFSRQLNLPVDFNATKRWGRSWHDFMLGADECISTSREEGFGMAFLEPWLAGKNLFGRNLPGVTSDFSEVGVVLDGMYSEWKIPVAILNSTGFEKTILAQWENGLRAYDVPFTASQSAEALHALHSKTEFDFGALPTGLQKLVIEKCCGRRLLEPPARPEPNASRIASNRAAIESNFALSACRESMLSLYQRALDGKSEEPQFHDATKILMKTLQSVSRLGNLLMGS